MLFPDFLNNINRLKDTELGGNSSHFKLAPNYRKKDYQIAIKKNKPKQAAVLVVFFPNKNNITSFILTKRASYDGYHSKQISFPGGKMDRTDISLQHTALRETREEIGITVPKNNIFKRLTDLYIPPSNFLVTPYLAFLETKPSYKINHEVRQVLSPTLSYLLDDNKIKSKPIKSNSGEMILTPYFDFENEIIWGATAMILSELKDLLTTIIK
jgi:8-oxo-dGTP pyrophosphatase MutT (NUDIX family)